MEVERGALGRLDASAVCSAVREAVLEAFDVGVRDVVLVRPESVPKTTSGKIQRVLSRRLYLAGDFQAAAAIGEPATA
jgi:acyl-CoA synthetase (AMP-forming)/AMP-acid ligase II